MGSNREVRETGALNHLTPIGQCRRTSTRSSGPAPTGRPHPAPRDGESTTPGGGAASGARKSAFGYYGGKGSKLRFILPHLQTPHETFVELCGGSAAVLLNKPPAKVEILNDLSAEVMTFWRVLRDRPAALQRAIMLSPAGEAEFKRILQLPPTDDPVETARRFYVRVAQAFNYMPASSSHALSCAYTHLRKRRHLAAVAERVRDIIVEQTDAARLIARLIGASNRGRKNTPILFYADPPYTAASRKTHHVYLCDDFDHDAFLHAITTAPAFCKFAVSAYDDPAYTAALAGWRKVTWPTHSRAAHGAYPRTECLWMNYGIE